MSRDATPGGGVCYGRGSERTGMSQPMQARRLAHLFDNHTEAVTAVRALEAAGFDHDHVSIMAVENGHAVTIGSADDPGVNEHTHETMQVDDHATREGTGIGASLGTMVGGGAGLLAGLGLIAIPGLGFAVAAGWVVALMSGAGIGAAVGGSAGGLVGALMQAGHGREDADLYAEGMRRGGTLVMLQVADEERQAVAEQILSEHARQDVELAAGGPPSQNP